MSFLASLQSALDSSLVARRAVRLAAVADRHLPVCVVEGSSAPQSVGQGYYWTTPSGKTIVRHSNAYGWRTRYWPSTRCVEVGADWLAGLVSVAS